MVLCGWSFKEENNFTGQWWFSSKGGTFDNVIEAIRYVECEALIWGMNYIKILRFSEVVSQQIILNW